MTDPINLTHDSYVAYIEQATIGWTADIAWHASDDAIGLQGPIFWRPTERWVQRRADRYISRRMRKHERHSAALANFTTDTST